MDSTTIVVFLVVVPWTWILMQFIMFGNILNIIPMILLGCLLYCLEKTMQKENRDKEMVKKTRELERKDCCSQTKVVEFADKSSQVEQKTSEESNQVDLGQSRVTSTESAGTNGELLIQPECTEFDEQATEGDCPVNNEAKIPTVRDKKKKRFNLRSSLFKKKTNRSKMKSSKYRVQTKINQPVGIPTVDAFLSYQKEHNYFQQHFEFKPFLPHMPEDEEKCYKSDVEEDCLEPKVHISHTEDGLKCRRSEMGENLIEENERKTFLKHDNSYECHLSEMIEDEIVPKLFQILDIKEDVNKSENQNRDVGQSRVTSTESAGKNGELLIQPECTEFDEQATEGDCPVHNEAKIPTVRDKKKKRFKLRSSKKKTNQLEMKSSKARVQTKINQPVDIPTVDGFLSYQKEHNYFQQPFEFKPILPRMPEVEEKYYKSDVEEDCLEPKVHISHTQDGLKSRRSEMGENLIEENGRKTFLKHDDSYECHLSEMIEDETVPKPAQILEIKEDIKKSENHNGLTADESMEESDCKISPELLESSSSWIEEDKEKKKPGFWKKKWKNLQKKFKK